MYLNTRDLKVARIYLKTTKMLRFLDKYCHSYLSVFKEIIFGD